MTVDDEQSRDTTAPVNEYMALREAKIARNQARLKELGLVSFTSRPVTTSRAPRAAPKARPAALPQRRSERKRSSHLVVDANDPVKSSRTRDAGGASAARHIPTALMSMPLSIQELKQRDADWRLPLSEAPSRKGLVAKNSARIMSIDVQRLLFGSLTNGAKDGGCLGKTMAQTGKAHVMEESARRAVNTDQYTPNDGGTVSFNKYAGVQEWGNDVLFLWINLGAPSSDVRNEFPQQGRHVTWYGGSQMHDQTNVIGKLKRVGMQIAEAKEASASRTDQAIVLWCRHYNGTLKTFGPYVCLGRLSLVSYDPTSRPLAFVWQLIDYDTLVSYPDTTVQDTFRGMVGID